MFEVLLPSEILLEYNESGSMSQPAPVLLPSEILLDYNFQSHYK